VYEGGVEEVGEELSSLVEGKLEELGHRLEHHVAQQLRPVAAEGACWCMLRACVRCTRAYVLCTHASDGAHCALFLGSSGSAGTGVGMCAS